MNENKKLIFEDEKTINLLDAFFYLLGKWKVMLAAALILAVLAGGLGFAKSNKAYQANLKAATGEVEEIELSEEELDAYRAKIKKLEEYKQNVEERDYYLENSILVKLDPNGFYEGTATYIFSADNSADALKALAFCKAEALKEENLQAMAKELSETVDPVMLREVLFFEENQWVTDSSTTMSLKIKTQHYTETDCEKMISFMTGVLDDAVKAQESPVEVTNIEPSVCRVSDAGKIYASADMIYARSVAYDNLVAAEEGLTETEKAFYAQEQKKDGSEKEEILEEILPETEAPSVSKKLVLIGAAAGVFLAAAYYAVLYLFDGKVHNREELESWLAVPVLNAEKAMDVTAAMLAEMAEKAQAKKLYLTGSLNGAAAKAAEEIRTALAAKNVEVILGAEGLDTADALQQMTDCGFVAFVEKCKESKEKDIREEITKAVSCGVKILGVVLEK